jgi:hypothetical protein
MQQLTIGITLSSVSNKGSSSSCLIDKAILDLALLMVDNVKKVQSLYTSLTMTQQYNISSCHLS